MPPTSTLSKNQQSTNHLSVYITGVLYITCGNFYGSGRKSRVIASYYYDCCANFRFQSIYICGCFNSGVAIWHWL